jgi:hypothetical protein
MDLQWQHFVYLFHFSFWMHSYYEFCHSNFFIISNFFPLITTLVLAGVDNKRTDLRLRDAKMTRFESFFNKCPTICLESPHKYRITNRKNTSYGLFGPLYALHLFEMFQKCAKVR